MSARQYIGARYVPKFSNVNGGVWSNSYTYEAMEIVKHGNDYYISKIPVPLGVDISNQTYWVLTGQYNGAINSLQEQINAINGEISDINDDILSVEDEIKLLQDYGDIFAMFPEARYSPDGTQSVLPPAIGKLAKKNKVPVVILLNHGNFLNQPFWSHYKFRKVAFYATMKQVITAEDIEKLFNDKIKIRYNILRGKNEKIYLSNGFIYR